MGHKQLILELPDNNFVSIDEDLYDLINKMNRSGIKTTQCCQGDDKTSPNIYFWYGMPGTKNEDKEVRETCKTIDKLLDDVDPDNIIQNMWFNLCDTTFNWKDKRNKKPNWDYSFAHYYRLNEWIASEHKFIITPKQRLQLFIDIWEKILDKWNTNYQN